MLLIQTHWRGSGKLQRSAMREGLQRKAHSPTKEGEDL